MISISLLARVAELLRADPSTHQDLLTPDRLIRAKINEGLRKTLRDWKDLRDRVTSLS